MTTPDRPHGSIRTRVRTALKAAVSLLLVGYLFSRVGWAAVWEEMTRADPGLLALYVILGLLTTLISAVKWRVLARARDLAVGLPSLFLLYLVGYFFNNVLPTSVGGDVVRAYELGRRHDRHREAIASVFVERFTGFTTLLVLVAVALVLDPSYLRDLRLLAAIGIAAAGYLAITWAVVSPRALEHLGRLARIGPVAGLLRRAEDLRQAITGYRHRPLALAAAVAYSVLFYVGTVLIVYTGCAAFGADVAVGKLVSAVPIMLLLFSIPVSIGGIGLQEWAYFFVLTGIGVSEPVALSLGLLFRVRTLAFGFIGGAVYPFVSGRPSAIGVDAAPSSSR